MSIVQLFHKLLCPPTPKDRSLCALWWKDAGSPPGRTPSPPAPSLQDHCSSQKISPATSFGFSSSPRRLGRWCQRKLVKCSRFCHYLFARCCRSCSTAMKEGPARCSYGSFRFGSEQTGLACSWASVLLPRGATGGELILSRSKLWLWPHPCPSVLQLPKLNLKGGSCVVTHTSYRQLAVPFCEQALLGHSCCNNWLILQRKGDARPPPSKKVGSMVVLWSGAGVLPRGGSGSQGKKGVNLCWQGEGNGWVAEGHSQTPGPLPGFTTGVLWLWPQWDFYY